MTASMSNKDVAEMLTLIADLLEIKGESRFRVLAYRRAAENVMNLGKDLRSVREAGELQAIPGVGQGIAEAIDELLGTGGLSLLDELTGEVPASLAELMPVPDLGPKRIRLFWEQLGIVDRVGLATAAKAGRLRDLPGMGEKSEAKILAGLQSLERRTGRLPLGSVLPVARELIELLRATDGVVRAELAGSLRRMRDTVGDIDILVAAQDTEPVMEAFTELPRVARVLGRGSTKSSVEFVDGLRAQLWAHPPERFGTALQYATGSKDHNVRLRERALTMNLSLSEHALTREGDGQDGEILCATEEEVYTALGLPLIPPELREDRGEIRAAAEGRLPELVTRGDIQTQLHNHSDWSDGRSSIREMVQAAIDRGLAAIAITDHSHSLGIAQGLDADRLREQREEIEVVRDELGDRIAILHGSEVEIRADGELDFPDEVLAWLDIVVASLHVGLRQPRQQVTARMLAAVRNPHVDIIGHPSGRLIPDREGADLDMEAVLEAAAESGVALEINANPRRLDLTDVYARRAAELGIPIAINTDAHRPEHLDFLEYGVSVARRGWVGPAAVLNTWPVQRLTEWLADRG